MSKSSPIGLPENVKIFDRAVEDFVSLDGRYLEDSPRYFEQILNQPAGGS